MALVALFNEPASGATLTSDIPASGAVVYTGADVFALGDLILIDSELMVVGNINTTSNTLTVLRGKWSTAAAHLAGAIIQIVNPYPNAVRRITQEAVVNHYGPAFGTAEAALVYMLNCAQDKALSVNAESAQDDGRQQAADDETTYRVQAAGEMPVVT